MNCTDIDAHIDDHLKGKLPELMQQAFVLHLVECKTCTDKVNGMGLILTGLKNMQSAEPTTGFEDRVFKEVRRQHQLKSSNLFLAGFATATAASLVLWFISTLFIVQQPLATPDILTVTMNDTKTIRLLFNAPNNIDQVTLSIDIPDNFELSGYPGRSQLSWNTSLVKGENILSLPVIAMFKGNGELIAQLNYGDKTKVFRIRLKAAEHETKDHHGAVNFQFKSGTSA